MDAEKLIEEGARAFQRVHDPDEHWDAYPEHWKALCRVRASAIIALTLKAAADEAENCHLEAPTWQQHETSEHIALHLRALAEQVEKANG